MVYKLLGLNWVVAGSVREELWTWDGVCKKNKLLRLIPLSIFWVVWKERNLRAFEGIKKDFTAIRDTWIHSFGSMLLGHDIRELEDFVAVFDLLIDL